MGYQDSNGLWHDKPSRKSNNVFIYGAYAKALGLDVSKYPDYFDECVISLTRDNITINRHPRQVEPPFSFDEALGAVYLGLIPYDALKGNHFVFHGHGKRLDERVFQKLVSGILKMVVAHNVNIFMPKSKKVKERNLFWKYNIDEIAYFAYRFNPAQTYIIKKFCKRKYHTQEEKLWAFFRDNLENTKPKSHSDYSQRNLLWLMHIMNNDHKRAKKLKPWINFEKYFGKNHTFTKAIRRKYGL